MIGERIGALYNGDGSNCRLDALEPPGHHKQK